MATVKNTNSRAPKTPFVFEWNRPNSVQEGLQVVLNNDLSERERIIETIEQFRNSNLFWDLLADFTDAFDAAKDAYKEGGAKEGPSDNDILLGFLARAYIAGSFRYAPVFDEPR